MVVVVVLFFCKEMNARARVRFVFVWAKFLLSLVLDTGPKRSNVTFQKKFFLSLQKVPSSLLALTFFSRNARLYISASRFFFSFFWLFIFRLSFSFHLQKSLVTASLSFCDTSAKHKHTHKNEKRDDDAVSFEMRDDDVLFVVVVFKNGARFFVLFIFFFFITQHACVCRFKTIVSFYRR